MPLLDRADSLLVAVDVQPGSFQHGHMSGEEGAEAAATLDRSRRTLQTAAARFGARPPWLAAGDPRMPREARWRLDSQWSVPEAVAEPWAALLGDEMTAVAGIVRTTVRVEHYPDEFGGDADVWQLDIATIVEAASPEEAARTADRAVDAAMSRFRLQHEHEFGWTKAEWGVAPAEE